jgi:hypothetical protein
MGIKAQTTGANLSKFLTNFAGVTDGLSNTILMAEDSGRHQVYAKRVPVSPNGPGQVGWTLNAAAFDYNTAIFVRGFSNDGMVRDGGCCVVNCNNVNQMYSFHTGGVMTLRGDGSVQYLKESAAPGLVAALCSRNGGEVLVEN